MPVTINISSTRALTVTGRLVAGESAAIAVTGGTPSALYLVDEKRAVVAACQQFEGGAGTINLATVPIGRIFATVPAGRAVSLACLVEGESGGIIGYGFIPVVSAPMPDDLVDVDVDTYIRASDIRALFADIPTEYSNQRSLSEALSQVVTVLKTLGLSVALALSALATEWQDVPATTVIGEGLTLTNGEIRAGGGGLDGGAVSNIVEGIVADLPRVSTNDVRSIIEADAGPTNRIVHADDVGDVSITGAVYAAEVFTTGGINATGDIDGRNIRTGSLHAGGIRSDDELEVGGNARVFGTLTVGNNEVKSAAYRDANEFATAADEALVYQLITNRLSGATFNFATVAGLYLAISNIVAAQGGAITNFPAIP